MNIIFKDSTSILQQKNHYDLKFDNDMAHFLLRHTCTLRTLKNCSKSIFLHGFFQGFSSGEISPGPSADTYRRETLQL